MIYRRVKWAELKDGEPGFYDIGGKRMLARRVNKDLMHLWSLDRKEPATALNAIPNRGFDPALTWFEVNDE